LIIELANLGRKFNRQWIFRGLSLQLATGNSYTFVGPNGSGKSTLLQIIAGIMPATEGTVSYRYQNKVVAGEEVFRYVVMATPYLELIEEFTLQELLVFHNRFKRWKDGLTSRDCVERMGLTASLHKPVKYFSSGMKQRLKLGLAFFSDTPMLLLDEPTTNLDAKAVEWYLENVLTFSANRLLVICSNQPHEYTFCANVIALGGN
jgi:ABC-2 type transport system ATP-binding protein